MQFMDKCKLRYKEDHLFGVAQLPVVDLMDRGLEKADVLFWPLLFMTPDL